MELAQDATGGVDLDLIHPGPAAQVRLVGELHAALADLVAQLVLARIHLRLELVGVDLTQVAELVKRQRPVWVLADRNRLGPHPGELLAMLGHVRERRVVDVVGHGHRGIRRDARVAEPTLELFHRRLEQR